MAVDLTNAINILLKDKDGNPCLPYTNKQDPLTATQLNAVNSGITSTKVGNYDNHLADTTKHITAAERTAWNAKQAAGNYVSYTNNANVTVAGTAKTVSKLSPETLFVPNGLIMGGSAQAAGLVTRGICGVGSPTATGAATKDNLYINYDGSNAYNAGRQVVIQAGEVGTHYGNNLYQYAAARGDAVKAYVDNAVSGKADASGLSTVATSGSYNDLTDKPTIPTITDTYSATSSNGMSGKAVASAISGKQATLTDAQLNAANSGITSTKVSSYDIHIADTTKHITAAERTAWNNKQGALSEAQLNACNSGITSAKVTTYDGYADAIAAKATDTAVVHLAGAETITGQKTISGVNLLFANSGTATRGIQGTCGDNDYWRVAGGATATNSGFMELSTADDGNEPIYVRQYTGVYTTLKRTATLLDANGNTKFPGSVGVADKVTLGYNTTTSSLDFIFA